MGGSYDVVIVGGGIAGSALAARLARAGREVLVLEHQDTYKDKVRGETFVPWGVRELRTMGVDDVLLAAGGEFAEALAGYDENVDPADPPDTPYAMLAPDVPGVLNVGHPEACEALAQHAVACGAEMVRGVGEVKVSASAGASTVWWTDAAESHEATCRLIVGADGRGSTVRRQLGIRLVEREPVTYGAGWLVRAESGFERRNAYGTEGDVMFLAFPRAGDLTRLYLLVDVARQRHLAGAGREQAFREMFRVDSFPPSHALAGGESAGPCGGAPMTDAWTETPPVVPGAVLVGDAAGWNDPIIGQGLSIAMRDARTVAEVLESTDDWSPAAFAGYVDERAERMRRLAIGAAFQTALRCTFTPEGRERRKRIYDRLFTDATVLQLMTASLVGPENVSADAMTDEALASTLAI